MLKKTVAQNAVRWDLKKTAISGGEFLLVVAGSKYVIKGIIAMPAVMSGIAQI